MIPRDTIDRVFSAARIEEVVGDYVPLKKRGANLIGLCPFHNEKTGSFTVSPSKGIYKCFGCGKSGHAVGFIMEIEQCGFADAVRQLAKKYHIEVEEREMTPEEQQRQDDRESMLVVNDFSNKWFQDQLWNTAEGKMAGLGYLIQKRGLREDIIHRFQLGYSPEQSLLAPTLIKHGFVEKFIINDAEHEPHVGTGVCIRSSRDGHYFDRFSGRVMFPFFSSSGKVIGFAGRIIKPKENAGKYVNSPTSPLFEKKNELYGFYQAKQEIQRKDQCYLVEGQLDVISMVQAGIENVVSSGGTSLTIPQIRLIRRFTNNVTILYDGDKAGVKAALRGIDMVLGEGMNVRIVLLPEGQDPDEFARSHNADEFVAYIEQNATDFIRFKTRILSEEAGRDPQKRAALINDVVESIAKIPDIITRQVYIKDTAEQLHMQEQILVRRLVDIRRGMRVEQEKQRHAEEQQRVNQALAEEVQSSEATPATPVGAKEDSMLVQNFRNLLQVVIRYGERPVQLAGGDVISAGDYIISEIQGDQVDPPTPLFRKVVDEYILHRQDPDFVAERFFKFHPDPEISSLAVDLIADKYLLSTIYNRQSVSENVQVDVTPRTDADKLSQLIPQLLLELKLTVINQRIEQLNAMLQDATDRGDWELIRVLLAGQPELLEFRNQICKALGNRVFA